VLILNELNSQTARILNEIILNAGIILWPSGGVYGLACDATNNAAVSKIYELKQRDCGKPLSIIANKNTAYNYACIPDTASKIINEYWPDFIGIIVPKKPAIKDFVTAGKSTIGLVCSSIFNEFLADNILMPLASTSANLSGEKEIIDTATAIKTFENKVEAIIVYDHNNGCLNTLIEFDEQNNFKIIREGKYSLAELKNKLAPQ